MAEHTAHDAGTSGEQDSDAAASGFDPASLHFVTRHVTEPERAAVTAVLGSVLEQESAMLGQAPGRGPSAWQRSQRTLRTPIEPGQGRWARPAL
ncbi:MAG: acyl-CoA carboxylase subunit epsilon [Microterricola sp.]